MHSSRPVLIFAGHPAEAAMAAGFLHHLAENGVPGVALTTSRLAERILDREGLPWRRLDWRNRGLNGSRSDDLDALCEADRGIRTHPRRRQVALGLHESWTELLDDLQPRAIFSDFGGEGHRRIGHRLAVQRGIPFWYLNFAPFSGRVFWAPGDFCDPVGTERAPLSGVPRDEAAHAAQSMLERLRAGSQHYMYFNRPAVTGRKLRSLWDYWWVQFRYERWTSDQWTPGLWTSTFVRKNLSASGERKLYRPLSGDYVFFPLHVPDDAQLTVRVPGLDQIDLIHRLADCLPPGLSVAVKGHPNFVGGYGIDFLTQLGRHPRVTIVDVALPAQQLVREAVSTVVVNSTTGLEALALRGKVLMFGPAYYQQSPGAVRMSIDAITSASIKHYLEAPPASDDAIRAWLTDLYSASFAGNAYYLRTPHGLMLGAEAQDPQTPALNDGRQLAAGAEVLWR